MQEYIKKEGNKLSSAPYMQYKIFLEDLSNTVEICNNKCINNYTRRELDSNEKVCLEKCYFKTLEMNQFVMEDIPNIANRGDYTIQKDYST